MPLIVTVFAKKHCRTKLFLIPLRQNMNADVLMSMYKNDPRSFKIVDGITLPAATLSGSKPQQLHLKGLNGSASQFILAAVHANDAASQLNHLVILRDAEEAAYFHNSLENITGALDVFYFPSSFKNKKNYQLLNSSHVMLRTEALTKITQAKNLSQAKKIVVTYPEAIFEKVVLSKTLSENIISIKQADELNVNTMLQRFIEHGFSKTDFVYEPGQFAIRGGILDIYSFGNEKPYRIELFGNEVDSIRIFDPETQLSERKLLQVNIIPNVETQFETGEKVSLLEFLPENTVVWMEDWEFIREKIEDETDGVSLFTFKEIDENATDNLYVKVLNAADFVNAQTLEDEIGQRHIIEIGKKAYFGGDKDDRQRTTEH
ncbi:MAG: hypothetical protein ACKVOM_11955, partial [Ferruginibacter sp.]